MKPTFLGLSFKAHPKPFLVSPPFAALAFSRRANKPVTALGLCSCRSFCLKCPPTPSPFPLRDPTRSSGSLPGLPGIAVPLMPPRPPARGLPCCFTASVTVLPSLVAWGSFQLWLPREVAGMRRNRGNGQEAVSGSSGEAITWTTVGLRRWGHGPTGRYFWTGRWDKQGGGEKGHSRKLVSGLRSWRHLP